MAICEHITEFAGKRVLDWEPGTALRDPEDVVYRLSISWDESEAEGRWTDTFASFLDDPSSGRVTGLVVGPWEQVGMGEEAGARRIVEAIVSARDRLPGLNALFLGEIISEENEISWIEQTDVSPVFNAYPRLEHFAVRGGNGLSLGRLRHDNLKTLIDAGAAALLASPAIAKLRKLDLHYHFCSEEMAARLQGLPVEVDAREPQEPDRYDGEVHRYVAVGE